MKGSCRVRRYIFGFVAVISIATLPSQEASSAITLAEDFETGSLDLIASSVTGTSIDLVPYRWTTYTNLSQTITSADNLHWWWATKVGGVSGLTPDFSIDDSNEWGGDYSTGYSPVWSYDQQNWEFFDNGPFNNSLTFSNDSSFTQSDVYVSYTLPYTPSMAGAHTASIASHPHVHPTGSANSQLIIGQTPTGHTDFRGNAVTGAQDLYGYQITDISEPGVKEKVVLLGGNHAAEHSGNFALQGMVDFLVSDHPLSEKILDASEFFVYPMADPEGRVLGHTRGNDSSPGPTSQHPIDDSYEIYDHNRFWDQSGTPSQPYAGIDTVREAIITDTGGSLVTDSSDIDWFFDFHGFPTSESVFNTNRFEVYDTTPVGDDMTGFIDELENVTSNFLALEGLGAASGVADTWAIAQNGLNAEHSFTPEIPVLDANLAGINFSTTNLKQAYFSHGADYARAYGIALFSDTMFLRENGNYTWDTADWAQANLNSPTPNSSSDVFIALAEVSGSPLWFDGPSNNTTLSGLSLNGYDLKVGVRGYRGMKGFRFHNSADLTINGDLVLEGFIASPATSFGQMGNLTADNIELIGTQYAAVLTVSSMLTAQSVTLEGEQASLRFNGSSNQHQITGSLTNNGGRVTLNSLSSITTEVYANNLTNHSGVISLLNGGVLSVDSLTLGSEGELSFFGYVADGVVEAKTPGGTGIANIAGTLDLDSTTSRMLGDVIDLITADGIIGAFDSVNDVALANTPYGWSLMYEDGVSEDSLTAEVRFLGDTNGDQSVDSVDVSAFIGNWLQHVTAGVFDEGDFNGDGFVDLSDWALLNGNFGMSGGGAIASIPEPASVSMLAVALGLFTRLRFKRQLLL